MKTSFILGDVRFARRVRQLLGVPILLSPHNINAYDNFEPVPQRVRTALQVANNKHIPLLLHMKSIIIPKYPGANKDVTIETQRLPPHFEWSMKKLNLSAPIQNSVNNEPKSD
jgi:hypothetical protein